MKQFCLSIVEDKFDLDNEIQTKAEFSRAIAVMGRIGGRHEAEGDQENWVGARFAASMWIHTKAVVCNKQSPMQIGEYMYSWEREIGRPNKLSTKIWKMMQSNNTKSENLESDFTEILEKTHLGWNETTKSIRLKFLILVWELLGTSLPVLSDLMVWLGDFEAKPADGKCGCSCG